MSDNQKSDPFAWMKEFRAKPMRPSPQHTAYAPVARDGSLRRAQEEEMLDDKMWQLALAEAYSTLNVGWLERWNGRERHEIVADYYRRHPSMKRFVERHIHAGTCGLALSSIDEELQRRQAGHDGEQTSKPINIAAPAGAKTSMSRAHLPTFVREYIEQTKMAGGNPSQAGLEKVWHDKGHTGERPELNAEFKKQMGFLNSPRGRPRKLAVK